MKEKMLKLLTIPLLVCLVSVDANNFLHYPRGSNNRLRETSANRNNGNRVFDSQVRYLDILKTILSNKYFSF